MSNEIDISDLDKAAVLAALFNGARPQGLGFLQSSDSAMTVEQARSILDDGNFRFDYLQGRVMKVNLIDDSFDPWLYDRDNGEGAAFSVIRALRETNDANAVDISLLHTHGTINAATQLQNMPGGDEAIGMARAISAKYAL